MLFLYACASKTLRQELNTFTTNDNLTMCVHLTSVTVRRVLPSNVTSSAETSSASFRPQTDHVTAAAATTTSWPTTDATTTATTRKRKVHVFNSGRATRYMYLANVRSMSYVRAPAGVDKGKHLPMVIFKEISMLCFIGSVLAVQ